MAREWSVAARVRLFLRHALGNIHAIYINLAKARQLAEKHPELVDIHDRVDTLYHRMLELEGELALIKTATHKVKRSEERTEGIVNVLLEKES